MNWQSGWRASWRERAGRIFAVIGINGGASLRQIAAATGFSKSSVHRHLQAMAARQQQPGGALWELESGQQWLRVLVCAVVYLFGVQQGIGNERLSEFFHLVHLERHIGVSPTAIAGIRALLEQQILDYHDFQQAALATSGVSVEICAGADETFFEQMVLVLLDLASGYIFVETLATNRRYDTWLQTVQAALGTGVQVKYLVSDRAKALVKLALEGLDCPSIADLFHGLREISKHLGCQLGRQLHRVETQLTKVTSEIELRTNAGKPTPVQQASQQQLQQQQAAMQATQANYHQQLQQLSLCVHPFAIDGSGFQTTAQVMVALQTPLQALKDLPLVTALPQSAAALDKFARQIPDLAAVINTWWTWVGQVLMTENLDSETTDWLITCLLPLVYWQQ